LHLVGCMIWYEMMDIYMVVNVVCLRYQGFERHSEL
jgi:hypothetical protein